MAQLLRVTHDTFIPLERTTMVAAGKTETTDLERWIKDCPQLIDDTLLVVTNQFGSWAAANDDAARERPDVLALSTSGELVVMELKRDGDRRIHLQAITYGALVAGFTKETLAQAHADWLARERDERISAEEALERLTAHVDSQWNDELLTLPRLLLVAEHFPAQVLTTVQWLATAAPAITIECHEYQLFRDTDGLCVSFQRLFPVDTLENRRLRPAVTAAANETSEQVATNRRRARSAKLIVEHDLIPAGALMTLELGGVSRPEVKAQVDAWLTENPDRARITWVNDPIRPLVWAVEPDKTWTPSALRNTIFARAGAPEPNFSAGDTWCYLGRTLWWIASEVEDASDV
ncbi:hypothetical protein [Actinoplanes sp. NPDC026619]|uniref:hypothetical protein n=1 Tax=Actinoplanes sp. NPDC026619 TaxID=3155798 RepID=UPI00340F5F16